MFVEVKDKDLTLKDLGLHKINRSSEVFLNFSKGFCGLSCLFNVLKREDLLGFGVNTNKFMQLAKWDKTKKV